MKYNVKYDEWGQFSNDAYKSEDKVRLFNEFESKSHGMCDINSEVQVKYIVSWGVVMENKVRVNSMKKACQRMKYGVSN